ncbi:hypothetical protein DPMN_088431 [Dreissena polymorpha]|uniref:Uncharacterized protein n=1 Tax=Dreissena polymorpha TaxID=45954 RepID=A0A9D4QXV7_DREPO|nr:hypothetical protein DPMN_088431 [Dreissena polymorpha]
MERTGDYPHADTISGASVGGLIVGIIVGVGSTVVYMRRKSPVPKSGPIKAETAQREDESGQIQMTGKCKCCYMLGSKVSCYKLLSQIRVSYSDYFLCSDATKDDADAYI